jgi:undecaprenyl pyrophosphate phosphatase UppP
MTSIMVSEAAGWGESREAARTTRRKRWRMLLVAVAILLVVGLPFLEGFIDGLFHLPRVSAPRPLAQITAAVILILGGIVTWRNWRETDEMQRRLAIETWAAIGLANFVLHPVLTIIGAQMHQADFEDSSWGIAILIGLAFYFVRRVRS